MPVIRYVDNQPEPKRYRAVINQTGTDAPVAIVIHNTLGFVPVWSRDSAGFYLCNSPVVGGFTLGKTGVKSNFISNDVLFADSVDGNNVFIINQGGVDGLTNYDIEIIVQY